jgi:hypothetical protein
MYKTHSNGNGNGAGPQATGARAQIQRLLKEHSEAVVALQTTLALMDGDLAHRKRHKAAAMVDLAVSLDAARRGQKKRKSKKAQTDRATRRATTAAFLKHFRHDEARNPPAGSQLRGVGTLVRHGYLVAKGKGFIRTDKVFTA